MLIVLMLLGLLCGPNLPTPQLAYPTSLCLRACTHIQDPAERLLPILRVLLSKVADEATATAVRTRVLQPLEAAVAGLRAAVSGSTDLLVAVAEFQAQVTAAVVELSKLASNIAALEDAIQEIKGEEK